MNFNEIHENLCMTDGTDATVAFRLSLFIRMEIFLLFKEFVFFLYLI